MDIMSECKNSSAMLLAIIVAFALSSCGGGGGNHHEKPPVTDPDPGPNPTPRICDITSFADLDFSGIATITAATPVAATANLSAHCRIDGIATPTSDSLINFQVWVPDGEKWNGKLVGTGNGGYSNNLSTGDMIYAMRQGYAVVGGDTGHTGGDDLIFGVGHPEKIVDWGSRSINAITVPAKQIITALKGQVPTRSYYIGCSTGGQQAFAEVQRYPDDYDGVIAGAPGSNRVALNVEFMWRFISNRPYGVNDASSAILNMADLTLMQNAALEACDGLDGVNDNVINNPRVCNFDITSLACPGGKTATCLTSDEIAAAIKIYGGPKRPNGAQLYPGWPFGSETQWNSYMAGNAPSRSDFWALWVFGDPHWDWWTFDFNRDMDYAKAILSLMVDQTNTDINAFKARGGKLIHYHGWNDGVVSAFDSIKYYESVSALQESQSDMDSFYRLFLIPGMGHCAGGSGSVCGVIRMDNQPEGTVFDPQRDILTALDRWVETGVAPNMIGSNSTGDITRPICSYPKKIVYKGGDANLAASFVCEE